MSAKLSSKIAEYFNPITYNYYDEPLMYSIFFKRNNLLNEENKGSVFRITGKGGKTIDLQVIYENYGYKLYSTGNNSDESFNTMHKDKVIRGRDGSSTTIQEEDIIENIKLISRGGRKAPVKKEVCGRLRCIYKIAGSRKEHIKYKGQLITVADYKKLMKKA